MKKGRILTNPYKTTKQDKDPEKKLKSSKKEKHTKSY